MFASNQRQTQPQRNGGVESTKSKGKLNNEVTTMVQGWIGVPARSMLSMAFSEKDGFPSNCTTDAKRKLFKAGIM